MISFRSKVSQKALLFYFLNPREKQHIHGLARKLHVDASNLAKKLQEFEQHGILKSELQGKQKYFSLREDFPLLSEYQKIIFGTVGIGERIRTALASVPGVRQVLLFGSTAANRLSSDSDIDLLIIGNHKAIEAERALIPLQYELGREINALDMSEEEFKKKKQKADPFFRDMLSKPLVQLIP
ncbi:nucleotidyltransferase domain-containing protein [Candidatus Woesearchaeota archaeon]|nr:nucleotidyltransferase domain-containing protein [Candidatus Woesearchaeota archaeon]